MSDIMRPMPFAHLMNWILSEYRAQGSVFGVSKLVRHADGKSLPIFEEKIESPYGPAAGPHTQLAQNIIAAYAAGSRFFEVKTVQVMDGEELSKCVSKPCITAADEYYNCEFDDRGNIGKRYRRQDEIGTPFCITYDFESETDQAVTVRDRDTMEQVRVPIAELKNYFEDKFRF